MLLYTPIEIPRIPMNTKNPMAIFYICERAAAGATRANRYTIEFATERCKIGGQFASSALTVTHAEAWSKRCVAWRSQERRMQNVNNRLAMFGPRDNHRSTLIF